MKPYALLSDQHCHAWSQFSTKLANGRNSRLQIILDEIERAAQELRAAGGNTLVFAGDLFHTRGSLDPEVLNPVAELMKALTWDGFEIVAIPGNHDLKSNETTTLGNGIQSLQDVNGFQVLTEPSFIELGEDHPLVLVPWIPRLDALKEVIKDCASRTVVKHKVDLILHAGIDGVLSGMPAHGLTPAYLAGLGFRRVFAGHYHNHVCFEAGKVWSIGAVAHHTYSDIGTKAGFLLVYEDRVVYRASRAPSFVEVTDETEADDIPLIVPGHYVRVRGFKLDDAGVNAMRRELTGLGAAGVTFQTERETATARTGSVSAKGVTLESSVDSFIGRMKTPHHAAIRARAAQIIADARASAE